MDPLDSLLRPGMKLTIAFDDISLPLPPMKTPDIRGRVIEHVLERAYRAGVDDIHLIAALALHRRMTPAELKRAVGARIFDEFYPDRLYNHDAEDEDAIVSLGETRHGEPVDLSKRAAESDLLVYVNINLVTMDGGHKSVAVGLSNYRSLRAHHTVHALRHSRSFMDPSKSELHRSAGRQGEIVEAAVPIFHIETTLNNDMYDGPLAFLAKPEARWTPREQTTFAALKRTTDRMNPKLRRAAFHKSTAPYAVTGVTAGAVSPVHEVTLEHCAMQQAVGVRGQADVVTAGLPYVGPYNVNSILNPILVMCMGLGYFFNLYQGVPLVREGGVMIFTHPVSREFHPVHHPSYVDFYEEVLSETTDPVEIEQRFEKSYAEDEWYRHLYRTSYAYHGVSPSSRRGRDAPGPGSAAPARSTRLRSRRTARRPPGGSAAMGAWGHGAAVYAARRRTGPRPRRQDEDDERRADRGESCRRSRPTRGSVWPRRSPRSPHAGRRPRTGRWPA